MFKLLRRISSFTYPHLDRPWSDDATSNAPTIGRKRKMSDADEDVQESGSTRKRRGQLERQDTSELGELGVKCSKGRETDPGVKEVTRGVKVVELEDRKEESRTDDGKEATSETVDGESNVAAVTAPLDPVHAPQTDDDPSQDVTATDDKAPTDQTEAAAEAPSNDLSDVEAPTSRDTEGPLIQEEKEEVPPDTTPEDRSEEVTDAGEAAESSPEP